MRRFVGFAMLLLAVTTAGSALAADATREWVFDAYLDGKPIGEHRFSVTTEGDRTTVRSRARFDVKLLGVTVYRYRHEADEVWSGGCLQSMRSRTDDDGDALAVDTAQTADGLQVTATKQATATYPGCVMDFAYWNPAIRQQTRLLNVQTGEYLPVVFGPLPNQEVEARGASVAATHWKLTGPANPLELWYGPGDDWVALESTVSGGRKLRYRLR